jgi:RHS repeat-associated protein
VVTSHRITGALGPYRDPSKPSPATLDRYFEYAYEDARVDVRGRGWLGFRTRSVKEFASATGIVSDTTYGYDLDTKSDTFKIYPLAGRPKTVVAQTYTDGPALNGTNEVTHTTVSESKWALLTSGAGRPYVALESQTTSTTQGSTAGAATLGTRTVSYVAYDANGKPYPDYDAYGNSRTRTTTWSDGRRERVETTYVSGANLGNLWNDYEAKWLVKLPFSMKFTGWDNVTRIPPRTKSYLVNFFYGLEHPGLPTAIQKQSSNFAEESMTGFRYDAYGNVNRQDSNARDALPLTETVVYDALGIFPEKLTNSEYESAHLPETEVGFDPRTGARRWIKTPNGHWVVQNYDAFGRLRSVYDDTGKKSYGDYFPGSNDSVLLVRSYGDGKPTIETEFNAFGQAIVRRTTHWVKDGRPKTSVTEFGYDEQGRLASEGVPHFVGTPSPSATSYAYDNLSRVTVEKHPWQDVDGTVHLVTTEHSYGSIAFKGSAGDPVRWADFPLGVKAHGVRDPSGAQSITVADQRGATVAVVDALNTTRYEYGAFGHLRSVTSPMGKTEFETNDFGRTTVMTDPATGVHLYTLNGNGQLRHYNRNGEQSTYDYDALGRTVHAITPDGEYTWNYDRDRDSDFSDLSLIGKLVRSSLSSATLGNSSTRYAYGNPGGTLSEVFREIEGEVAPLITEIEPDVFGRPEVVRYPAREDGQLFSVKYRYSEYGRIDRVYDAMQPLTDENALWRLDDVDAFGHTIKTQTANGVVTMREYEPATGRLSHSTITGKAGAKLDERHLWYEGRGLLLSQWNMKGAESYVHDELGRLKTRYLPNETLSYEYWPNGDLRRNPESPELGELRYEAESGERVIRTDDERTYRYDVSGRQYLRQGGSVPQQRVGYTAFDLPLAVQTGPDLGLPEITQYRYDANNARIGRKDPNGDETLYVGGMYERMAPKDGNVERRVRIATPDGDTIEAQLLDDGNKDYRFQSVDHLGSLILTSTSAGSALGGAEYSPFGRRSSRDGSFETRRGFTGHEHDDTGLINMRGRMYDPVLGRFLTADPFVQAPGLSQSWNHYAYVFNSPLNFVDPTGFQADLWEPTGEYIETLPPVVGTYLPPDDGYDALSDLGNEINNGADPSLVGIPAGPAEFYMDRPLPKGPDQTPRSGVPLAEAITDGVYMATMNAAEVALKTEGGILCAWFAVGCGVVLFTQAENEDEIAGPTLMVITGGLTPRAPAPALEGAATETIVTKAPAMEAAAAEAAVAEASAAEASAAEATVAEAGTAEGVVARGGGRAIGFADDAVGSAFQGMRSGGGHAMRHLIDEGLIPNAGSLASRAQKFQDLVAPILSNPTKTFGWRIGGTAAQAFAGSAGGRQVVAFVAKEGPYQGRVLSAIVPDAAQIAQWGL